MPDRTREAALERLLDAAGAVPWEANSRTGQFTQATTLEARMTKLGIKRGPGPGTTS